MKGVVVLPTYNERDNVAPLIDALQAVFPLMGHEMDVLVVDDHSPDGTAEVVRALKARHTNVHLIEGKKAGLGAAYIRGMRFALDELHADVVFGMDADFSHKPADLVRLMAAIDQGADFVIGSRYVPGGSVPSRWAWHRKLNSRAGNLVARYVAGIYRVHDCTSGFRAIRASILRRIDFSELRVQGYAFLVALLHAACVRGARVREIPIEFVDRVAGESKLGLRDIVEFIANAWWIRVHSSRTFIKFGIVGASGVVVNLGAFTLLMAAGLGKFVASPIAIELSIIWNFLFNNYWTFRQRKTKDRVRIKGLKFNAVSVVSLAVSYSTFVAVSLLLPSLQPQIAQFIGIVPAMLVNYFLNAYWTFRPLKP